MMSRENCPSMDSAETRWLCMNLAASSLQPRNGAEGLVQMSLGEFLMRITIFGEP